MRVVWGELRALARRLAFDAKDATDGIHSTSTASTATLREIAARLAARDADAAEAVAAAAAPGHRPGPPWSPAGGSAATEHLGDPVEAMITQRSSDLGLRTPGRHAVEAGLLIDEPLLHSAVVAGHPQPGLLFGKEEWAGYLDARAYARGRSDQELSVAFITDLHRRLAQFSFPDIGGKFCTGTRTGLTRTQLTRDEVAAIEANPYLEHMPPGTVPLHMKYSAIAYRTKPEAIESELQAMCDRYNFARARPGADPYRLAADLQRDCVAIHPFVDYNGRVSRLLMNWSLERDGLPPSTFSDFNRDLFSTSDQWTGSVREGSDMVGERIARLERLGENADPVEVFGLERERASYLAGNERLALEDGDSHQMSEYRAFLQRLRDDAPP